MTVTVILLAVTWTDGRMDASCGHWADGLRTVSHGSDSLSVCHIFQVHGVIRTSSTLIITA